MCRWPVEPGPEFCNPSQESSLKPLLTPVYHVSQESFAVARVGAMFQDVLIADGRATAFGGTVHAATLFA
jgi:hypothetical protein